MTHLIKKQTDLDLSNKIIPLFHDESYVNRYLLTLNPKIISTKYATNEWYEDELKKTKKEHPWRQKESKAILINKHNHFNAEERAYLKAYFTSPYLFFLVNDKFQPQKIAIIKLINEESSYEKQCEAILSLISRFPNRKFYIYFEKLSDKSKKQLKKILEGSDIILSDLWVLKRVSKVNNYFINTINYLDVINNRSITDTLHPIWIIS